MDWSPPDADGVRTCVLYVGALSTLRGKRLRRSDHIDDAAIRSWPAEWRTLAREWLVGGSRTSWSAMLKKAGPKRVEIATDLLTASLIAGWIEVEEQRDGGRPWTPRWVSFHHIERLRVALDLPDRDALANERAELLASLTENGEFSEIVGTLTRTSVALAIRRLKLLRALADWQRNQRSGTRRDFSNFAVNDTKGISPADWSWLEAALPLGEYGVEPHTPLLLIRAPLRLQPSGARLDVAPDFFGLTPATIAATAALEGHIEHWRLYENRTNFERGAKLHGERDGVVWLPGFPPEWWRDAIRSLCRLVPAPLKISCDPDPAGIEIALQAGALWEGLGLPWNPSQMDPQSLSALPARKKLTDDDHSRLDRLLASSLPTPLRQLAEWMQVHGEKGEQEGLPEEPAS